MFFKKCVGFVKGNWLWSLACPVLLVLTVSLEVKLPAISADILDSLMKLENQTGTSQDVAALVIKMLGYTLGILAIGIATNICAAEASLGFSTNARCAMFNKIQDLSFENMNKFTTASLITRLSTDINSVQMVFRYFLVSFIKTPITIVYTLIYIMRMSKGTDLAQILLFGVPALVLVLVVLCILVVPLFKEMLKRRDKFNSTIRENANGIRVVKTFVREDFEREKFYKANNDITAWVIKANTTFICIAPFIAAIMSVCMMVTLWRGSKIMIANAGSPSFSMKPADLLAITSYITELIASIMSVLMIIASIVAAKASLQRVKEVLMEEPSIRDDDADTSLLVKDGSVEMKNVCFRYDKKAEKPILDNVCFSIKSGERVGIIGGTGSGKSTLVQLIPRLYDAAQGEVLVGGRSVKDYTVEHLRDAISIVLQQNVLFSGSISDNIRWGKKDATQQEVEHFCSLAAADEFIKGFTDGYETNLGSGGVNLSGGQKQRLCIARAMIKKPKILIMDDSTSAVDTATEASIRNALDSEDFKDTTIITIAQRITSVMYADKIIIIDDGKIDAVGTHDELLKNNEIYREIYVSQQEGVLAQ